MKPIMVFSLDRTAVVFGSGEPNADVNERRGIFPQIISTQRRRDAKTQFRHNQKSPLTDFLRLWISAALRFTPVGICKTVFLFECLHELRAAAICISQQR
jgi:hypothetical protein